MAVFSKRAAAIDDAMAVKLDEFRHREGREPSPKERAALEREASADTRGRKSGLGVADLATRWQGEAAEVGWTVERLVERRRTGRCRPFPDGLADRHRRCRGGVGAAFVVGQARCHPGDL